jgi:hypothetical protein
VLTREVLLEEFVAVENQALTEEEFDLLSDTVKAAMVLSAPPKPLQEVGSKQRVLEKTEENIVRVEWTVWLLHQLLKSYLRKAGKPNRQITAKVIQEEGYLLILNGETEQLPMMVEVTLQTGWPATNIILLDCGKRGAANTKTQFEAFNKIPYMFNGAHDLRQIIDHWRILVVTTWYHVPRVRRTAAAARKHAQYKLPVIGVPRKVCSFPTAEKVEGEIERILTYAEKDDIRPFPRKQEFTSKTKHCHH